MKRLGGVLLLALSGLALAAKPFPPPPRSYIYNEGVVSASTERELSAYLESVERNTGHQFVVALFQSLDGESLEDYSNRLFKEWKIGDAKRNDGLLFCLFLQDKRWRVEVGYGLEGTLTDLEAGEIARDQAVPHFRQGDFDAGVRAAIRGLGAKLSGEAPPPRRRGRDDDLWPGLILPLIFFFFLPLLLLYLHLRYGFRFVDLGGGRGPGGWSSGGGWGGGGGWSGGGGGFSGGGGSSGGGGASGGW